MERKDPLIKYIEREVDGRKMKLRIQFVTPELVEAVIEHMFSHFFNREPLCASLKLSYEPLSVDDFVAAIRGLLSKGLGLVMLLETGGGDPAPLVVAANITFIRNKSDPKNFGRGHAYRLVCKAVDQLFEESRIFERYGVDRFLQAFGLSVHRDFHGLGLGRELVHLRERICKENGLTMSATVFSAGSSTHIAASEGFQNLLVYDYKDFVVDGHTFKIDGKISLMLRQY